MLLLRKRAFVDFICFVHKTFTELYGVPLGQLCAGTCRSPPGLRGALPSWGVHGAGPPEAAFGQLLA